jgi:putative two-component system response regulator
MPDFITIVVSNVIIVVAAFIIYLGFAEFVKCESIRIFNYALIIIYIVLQYLFTFTYESTSIRIILISVITAIFFIQSAMLLLNKNKHNFVSHVKTMGYASCFYVFIQCYRIFVEIVQPTQDYFGAGSLATIGQLGNQFLTIIMVFSFIISVNSVNLANRIKNEIDVKDRERKLRNFIDNASDWEYWIKNDGNIEYMTPSAFNISGYYADEFIKNPSLLTNIIHPQDIKAYTDHSHEEKCNIDYRIIDRQGETHWIEQACKEIFSESNEFIGRHVSIRDITEKKDLEEKLKSYNYQLECDVSDKLAEVAESQRAAALSLAKITESRDYTTGMHIERVQKLCRAFSYALNKEKKYEKIVNHEFINDIYYASVLHDIGKVAIPDAVLLKPGKLTNEEFDIIKSHVEIGAKTLEEVSSIYKKNPIIQMGIEITKYHHEKWNGKGYMKGLLKENIPLPARIMAIVDAYDAIRSKRPYKESKTHDEAFNIICQDSGEHFDPNLVDIFKKISHKFEEIYNSMVNND